MFRWRSLGSLPRAYDTRVDTSLTLGRVLRIFAAAATLLLIGTIGFKLILDESWINSFYRTVVTASLNGLDLPPPSTGGKLWTVVIVLGGVTIFAYVGVAVVEAIAGGVVTGAIADRRRWKTIDQLSNHFIICGYGRVGRRVAQEFRAAEVPYVVLDFSVDALNAARERGSLYRGDGTGGRGPEKAGLERARGLVASSDSDSDNLYITLGTVQAA